MGVTIYTLKKDSNVPANYHCTQQHSPLLHSVLYYSPDQMIHPGALVNNTDLEPYPKGSVLDCLGMCLSMFVFKHLIRQVWEIMPLSKSGNRKGICLARLFSF